MNNNGNSLESGGNCTGTGGESAHTQNHLRFVLSKNREGLANGAPQQERCLDKRCQTAAANTFDIQEVKFDTTGGNQL